MTWTRRTIPFALGLAAALVAVPALAQEEQGAYEEAVASALADETRPEAERAQDAGRKPLEVYRWMGVEPGMTVADVYPGKGYNTHLLSRIAGDEGRVYAVLGFYDGQEPFGGETGPTYDVQLRNRVAETGLDNVEVVSDFADVPPGTVDVAILIRNYHDIEHVIEGTTRKAALDGLLAILKPGGFVGIVEVDTDRPGWDEETHRLNKSVVIDDFTGAGFVMVGESDLLDNPDDDHSTSGFEIGRHTVDRYILGFRKPE